MTIDVGLLGVDGHLVKMCPLCYASTVRAACPILGTLDEDLLEETSDVYECPSCRGWSRRPCPLEEAA